jgi:hypothetical protein
LLLLSTSAPEIIRILLYYAEFGTSLPAGQVKNVSHPSVISHISLRPSHCEFHP